MADWVANKTEYVTGEISQRKLAEKYGVSYSSLRAHSEKERWTELREEQRRETSAKAAQKAAEKIAEVESEIASLKAKARLSIWQEIERRIKGEASKMDGSDLRRMVQNYCDMSNADPEDNGPSDTDKEDDLSKSLRELGQELESDE